MSLADPKSSINIGRTGGGAGNRTRVRKASRQPSFTCVRGAPRCVGGVVRPPSSLRCGRRGPSYASFARVRVPSALPALGRSPSRWAVRFVPPHAINALRRLHSARFAACVVTGVRAATTPWLRHRAGRCAAHAPRRASAERHTAAGARHGSCAGGRASGPTPEPTRFSCNVVLPSACLGTTRRVARRDRRG
jgi:hypothetical protein